MASKGMKVVMIGPIKSGKTLISTYLSDSTENLRMEYKPTHGVRIIEFESIELSSGDQRIEPEVELWDCSGDRRYETCWPAMRRFVDAVIITCNPGETKGDDLILWHNEFVQKVGLRPQQAIVFLHHSSENTNDSAIADFKLPQEMMGIRCVPVNVDREGDQLRKEFSNFLYNVSNEYI
ncbi:unnamed protein product [Bursaphelenchus xylophilus]|uniref:(pine wood nematode) hypothetical protein n=1 Tax=Bursaphelenchus xylophilus TaxID=6326 RepID=A0A1I7RHC1_BURXY|nr:unnamed protein product [Bursaphelenchus xylophilus]CAG9115860.1 unnamed protein product [Bursaphelenchus xylophilus]